MADPSVDWRSRYIELLREGEACGLRFAPLGHYIAARMTPEELRAGLREFYTLQDTHKQEAAR